jgi:hypothetical protein
MLVYIKRAVELVITKAFLLSCLYLKDYIVLKGSYIFSFLTRRAVGNCIRP